jgi:VCBS repeat-containing protein
MVNDVNDAPTLTVDSTKTVAEDGTTSISFEADDVDGTVVTTATAKHGTVDVNSAVAVVVTVPSTSPASKLMLVVPSSATVFVLSTVSVGASLKIPSITVNDVNDAPTLTVDSTKTVAEDGTTSISFEAGDVDGTVTTTAT